MLFDDSFPSIGNDIFAHHGRQIILTSIDDVKLPTGGGPIITRSDIDSFVDQTSSEFLQRINAQAAREAAKYPVGILGAGM